MKLGIGHSRFAAVTETGKRITLLTWIIADGRVMSHESPFHERFIKVERLLDRITPEKA
jgi:hypothetical protein